MLRTASSVFASITGTTSRNKVRKVTLNKMYKLPTYNIAKQGSGGGTKTFSSNPYRRSKTKGSLFSRRNRLTLIFAGLLVVSILFSALFMYRIQQSDKEQDGYKAEDVGHIQAMPSPAFCNRLSPPLICAHGGDNRMYPPNTLEAFQAALDVGADCVEVDVARTSDNVMVVLHIRELQQVMGSSYKPGLQVADMSWQDLQALRWPSGEAVARAEDVINRVSSFVSTVILDVKTYNDARGTPMDEAYMVQLLLKLVHDTQCVNCLIWAKSDAVVRDINMQSPGQSTGYVLMNGTQEALRLGMNVPMRIQAPKAVASHFSMVDHALVRRMHSRGKRLFVWTVNEAFVMKHMLDVAVDGVVTNKPGLLKDAIEWRIAHCADTPHTSPDTTITSDDYT